MDRMSSGPEFRSDLYRGTARSYDEFRLPYPQPLLDDLLTHARATGAGRLLDLACGTGQITFGLASNFVEIWAVDQEPEAVDFARAQAFELGVVDYLLKPFSDQRFDDGRYPGRRRWYHGERRRHRSDHL